MGGKTYYYMKVNGIEIAKETIEATRVYFADLDRACIDEAISGQVYVNDLEAYVKWREKSISDCIAGLHDHTVAFLQTALWLQTGECVAILS
jgi:hypothetical protein